MATDGTPCLKGTLQSALCVSRTFEYEMPSLSFYMQQPKLQILAMNSTFIKLRATLVHPLLPFPTFVLSFSASFLFLLGCGEVFLRSGTENP